MNIVYCVTPACVYTVHTDWVNLKGGTDELKLSYKLPATGDIAFSPPPVRDPECDNGFDDDGDRRIDFPADPDCDDRSDDRELVSPVPLPPQISDSSYNFRAWHLLATSGSRQSKTFTITNASPADLNLTTVSISGADASSFLVTGNDCSGRTLAPGESCQVKVEFSPPSGSSYNYFGNSGTRSATLTVDNADGVQPASASLSGRTISDRMRPGDTMGRGEEIRAYNGSCYDNAETCPVVLFMRPDNGRIDFDINGRTVWARGDGQNADNLNMQASDGNLVLSRGNTPVWASQLDGAPLVDGAWLLVHDSSQSLTLMYPDWQTSARSIFEFYRGN